jgi:hypothetical protein
MYFVQKLLFSIRKSNAFPTPAMIKPCYHRLGIRMKGNFQLSKSIWFMPLEVIEVVRGEPKPVITCQERDYSSLLFLF